jgi:hypothetical protein
MTIARITLIVGSLLAMACGPPRVASTPTDDETETGWNATGEPVTTDSEDSETSTSTPTSVGFVPPDDFPPVNTCDPWLQDCPEGEKCVPYGSSGGNWDANKCVPIMGDQAPGEPCTWGGILEATDDCDANGACLDVTEVDGELVGTCFAFCMGAPDNPECPEGFWCPQYGDGSLTFCHPVCDPIVQDCDRGEACFWAGSHFECVFTTQDIPAGQPCGYINDCAAGLFCMDAAAFPACEGSACCTPFCDLMLGDGPCEAIMGTMCVPFFEEGTAPPGYDNLGVCLSA